MVGIMIDVIDLPFSLSNMRSGYWLH